MTTNKQIEPNHISLCDDERACVGCYSQQSKCTNTFNIRDLTQTSVLMSNLPEQPGYNGSILLIDDDEADRVAKTLGSAAEALRSQQKRIEGLNAVRIAYASEFPHGVDGCPDIGSIHQNIRALKARLSAIRQAVEKAKSVTGGGILLANAHAVDEIAEILSATAPVVNQQLTTADTEPAHSDHPLRHWDRSCPACNPDELMKEGK